MNDQVFSNINYFIVFFCSVQIFNYIIIRLWAFYLQKMSYFKFSKIVHASINPCTSQVKNVLHPNPTPPSAFSPQIWTNLKMVVGI